jgi:IS30 family transposase
MSVTEVSSVSQERPLRRTQIREILKRHVGSIARIAEQLGVTSNTVSLALRGKITSKRVMEAAEAKARELLQLEQTQEQPTHAGTR